MPSFGSGCRRGFALTAVITSVALAGCGDRGPRRYHVRGAVTFAGQPVRHGRIVFDPDQSRGHAGPQGFAPIENGRFDTSNRHCRGTVGGPTIVRIDALEIRDGADGESAGRLLFPTHEERIDLPQADITRDFDVPKKGKT